MATLTLPQKRQLVDLIGSLADENGLRVGSYRPRGMRHRCLAVRTVSNPAGFGCMLGLAAGRVGALIDDNVHCDELGLDFVVYWPDLAAKDV